MKAQECLKDLVSCIYSLDNWKGIDAKWFQECSQSSQEYITMYTNTRDAFTYYLIGADDETASALETTKCWPKVIETGSRIPFLNSGAHNMLIKNFVQYVATANQKH